MSSRLQRERLNPGTSLLLILLHIEYNNMKTLKIIPISLLILVGFVMESRPQIFIGTTEIDTSSIVTGLDTPWEILWGPDDHIWLSERNGTISRLNPESGDLTELISIGDVNEENEGGLLGMVLHPDFINHPHVFVVYNYIGSSGIEERLVRYTYSNGELGSPVTLLEGIDGAGNHNGSRLVIDAEQKLYMTTGDAAKTSQSQDINSLNGKVLRMNLDGSVPEDNPVTGSYIWTWGHRNAQGLVISPAGLMYSSEHGTSNDDEVNIIEKGRNYGWPNVEGFCDEPSETQFCSDSNVVEPIVAWTPTLAVAGTDFYNHAAIPEWQNSLLVTTLKDGSLVVLQLSADGRSVISEELLFYYWWGRLRDICISPDGRVFLAVSNRDGRGTVQAGDDRIVELSSSSAAAIHSLVSLEFSVYPNPASGTELNIDYNISTEGTLTIYSQDGKEIKSIILAPGNMNMKVYLPKTSGLYNLVLTNKEGVSYRKVLKL